MTSKVAGATVVDGFNQKVIKEAIYNRINNPNRSDGTWTDPQKKTMAAQYRKANHAVELIPRKANKVPLHLAEPPKTSEGGVIEESKAKKDKREKQAKRFAEEQKGRFDLYVRQGNPSETTTKLQMTKDIEIKGEEDEE